MATSTVQQATAAIVVTYFPQEAQLFALLEVLSTQCCFIVLVANSPLSEQLKRIVNLTPQYHVIANQKNVGLALAQNQGAAVAREKAAKWLFFFDQDSLPCSEHIKKLICAYELLTSLGYRPAAIGPLLLDTRTTSYWPFYMTDWFHLREIRIPTIGGCTPASYVLSSGTLISRLDFDAIGDFDGSLFIDNIDVEWGFRAAHLGYQNFGCFDVTMQHTVGDCHVHFLGKLHPLHSPQRHYFIFRNSIRLIRLSYIPVKWKVNELLRIIPRLLVYSFFSEMPIDHFRAGVSGIIDGILFHRQS